MSNLTIPAQIIRSAQQCVSKDDVRPFTHGILFAANGDVMATDGKTMFLARECYTPPAGHVDTIIQIYKAIPARSTTIYIDTDQGNIETGLINTDIISCRVINVTAPAYERVLPADSYTDADVTIALSSEYLARVGKVFPHSSVSLHHGPAEKCMIIKPVAYTGNKDAHRDAYDTLVDALMLIMPVQLPSAKPLPTPKANIPVKRNSNNKLQTLADSYGLTVDEMIADHDSVIPGICVTPGCNYTTDVEPDATENWCEECRKGTVSSALILAGII